MIADACLGLTGNVEVFQLAFSAATLRLSWARSCSAFFNAILNSSVAWSGVQAQARVGGVSGTIVVEVDVEEELGGGTTSEAGG